MPSLSPFFSTTRAIGKHHCWLPAGFRSQAGTKLAAMLHELSSKQRLQKDNPDPDSKPGARDAYEKPKARDRT
ncbi:hypothetical protein [Bordetella trematum]|uniref:hypothetical protein n=1 Tax=Bordetella trematum TaxID=123899 RepID=UPI003989EA6B